MVGDDYEISLSNRGRAMAEVALKKSHYAGPAPVPLADYNQSVSVQAVRLDLSADTLKAAMNDLVLPNNVISELGASLMTGGAIMLYGSTGNGKTSIAERLPRIFEDDLIHVPHAIEVAGQIITVYDPLIHRTGDTEEEAVDPRWVLCRRPMVKVGGEMRADMLDTRIGRSHSHMRRALTDEGQQRHLADRRLRPPAHHPPRIAEPLDRSAGPPQGHSFALVRNHF
jgi:hypothetical protein